MGQGLYARQRLETVLRQSLPQRAAVWMAQRFTPAGKIRSTSGFHRGAGIEDDDAIGDG